MELFCLCNMNHTFDTEHACAYGVREAILISNIQFWIAKNKANRKHFHKDRYWTYNSVKAWSELFPYFSSKQVRTGLDSLVSQGVLLTDNLNQSAYDRTLWYAFTDEWSILTGQMDLAEKSNPFAQTGKTLTSTDINTDERADGFASFWNAYPKKKGKEAAVKAWAKVPADAHEFILASLAKQSQSKEWTKEEGQYIPLPATWINGKRWQDDDGDSTPADRIGSFI